MYTNFFALASLVALVSAGYGNVTTITHETVVTEFTTFCPFPTTFVTNNATFTVTAPTTLTITNCPCTIKTTETCSVCTTKPAVTTVVHETVVTQFTTFCPSPTTFVTNGQSFTVTAPTTLTVTNCPCTIKTTETISSAKPVTAITTTSKGTETVSTHIITSTSTPVPIISTGGAVKVAAGTGIGLLIAVLMY
jgi:hypothetical protein